MQQDNMDTETHESTTPLLPRWAIGFPGLIWQIELPISRLSVIKTWHHPELGPDTSLLLKDRAFRKRMVMHNDLPALESFWDIMLSRESATVSFCLKSQPSRPLMLQGWAHPQDGQIYSGMLQYDYTREVLDGEQSQIPGGINIQRSRYPILVINIDKNLVLRHNKTAELLFKLNGNPMLHLNDIAPSGMSEKFIEAATHALKNDIWSGALSFAGTGSFTFTSRVRISNCSDDSARMVRVSFLEMPRNLPPEHDTPVRGCSSELLKAIQKSLSLHEALSTLLNMTEFPPLDGLMFSNILSHQGQVEVYGVGKAFENIPWGAPHSYEGTIAQDIEGFNLRSLIMDDTRDSIKSIDWVLFIPRGIRSYFAKPFFIENKLHAIMILASATPKAFPPDSEHYFAHIDQPFMQAVDNWRKYKK